ncbi:drug resistance transporter, EmrB/QacA subfamily [Streptoalloteichus tenebrarius]|uniref:Drug resistance transporter, EmrB/QacA subfamily n=1 Tax=Streptoalloteichus tenebrarius (strain ATCC 17920 / DSM 40477 / JCM 4838 / CBS 697.72 / NBRC 16177 / NCIMB 11028 / NRRL B-12390 / A12253. 1 / ISP 5477) TaxID=1933 RepID=A0ABT1HR11_STRSD|nr:MDR family MFS transporter [Streptoalloteichus tenebrarius]MCP2257932.1 drug resistance transporter, EmrB/QacA subfamily [Streptoalloteichus tenebrarius]BFF01596.1 MDR family MFS transporter [Streptoalloteichus tenebrarius]
MSDTDARAVPAPAGGSGALSHRQIVTILSGLMLGMLLAALDQTIVSAAMRTIADQLHGQSAQAWATTAYLITSTISTPLYGKLSDIYGRRPFYLASISIFLVGSALCGVANSMYELAAFRAVQGLGAGGLFSLAIAIMGDIIPPRERGRYQGYFMAVFGSASVLGPVVGGFFAGLDTFLGFAGWRWVFLINLPIGVVALIVVTKVLKLPHNRVNHRVDYLGALALTVGLVPLLIVAEQGREWGWTSGNSIAMYVVGVVGLALFVLAERRMGDEAVLPLRLFRSPVFSLGNILNFIVGMGMFGGLLSLPLYLQIVKGTSPTESGLLMVPLTLGIMLATGISGTMISRTGRYKVFPIIGAGAMTVSLLLFSRIGVDTPLWEPCLTMVLMGAGLGLCMQTLVMAVQNDVAPKDMGVATASATFFRQTGGTVGAAVFMSILFGVVGDRIADAFREAAQSASFKAALADPAVLGNPANQPVLQMLKGQQTGGGPSLDDTSFLANLDPRLARPFLEGFSSSMDTVFLAGAIVTAVAFVLNFFLKEVPLPSKSNLERVSEERDAMPTIGH